LIASLHMRELDPSEALRALMRGRLRRVPGLITGDVVVVARLSEHLLPRPDRHRVAAFAFWSDEDALDRFQEEHEAGALLAGGWQMRMQPTRLVGSWPGLGSLGDRELPMDLDEPAAGLTLGQLRPSQVARFLKASARAERDALNSGAMLASTGLARPPGLVSTFSVWRSLAALRDYIGGVGADGHGRAVQSHAAKPFHRESAFVRMRPLATSGDAPWWPALQGMANSQGPPAVHLPA
jgi:hypothetical protein